MYDEKTVVSEIPEDEIRKLAGVIMAANRNPFSAANVTGLTQEQETAVLNRAIALGSVPANPD